MVGKYGDQVTSAPDNRSISLLLFGDGLVARQLCLLLFANTAIPTPLKSPPFRKHYARNRFPAPERAILGGAVQLAKPKTSSVMYLLMLSL